MRFTDSHEWIRLDGVLGTVGITDYAQRELGEIVYIELPQVGTFVKAGQEVCVLESTKAAADVYAPVTGKIVAVNEAIRQGISAVNKDAENAGWLFRIEALNPEEAQKLLSRAEYAQLIG